MTTHRFQDENKTLSEFYDEVLVVCPVCAGKAVATVNTETEMARMQCLNCAYFKEIDIRGNEIYIKSPAHTYFNAQLWLQAPFKNEVFWAFNKRHLIYLENYIAATIRESMDRTGFTLLERLPKFIHSAKNREALLKVIDKLKHK